MISTKIFLKFLILLSLSIESILCFVILFNTNDKIPEPVPTSQIEL